MITITENQRIKINEIIKSAGDIILEAVDVVEESNNISIKSSEADLVTIYDKKVQNKLITELSALFPNSYFYAEEKTNDTSDILNGLCFVIDPIDGTANFVHKLCSSVISVALLYKGDPIYGCIYNPYKNELFYAIKDNGAYLNDKPIHVSHRELSSSIISFGTSPYYKNSLGSDTFNIAKNIFMNCSDFRRSGSAALDLAYVACGRIDAFFELKLFPWDYAAGVLLVKEAGGFVSNINGDELLFIDTQSVFSSNIFIKDKILKLIQL